MTPTKITERLAAIKAEKEQIQQDCWREMARLEAEERAIAFAVSAYEEPHVSAPPAAKPIEAILEKINPPIMLQKHLTPADYILQSMKRIGPATVSEIRKDLNGAIEPNANLSAWFSLLSRRNQAERLTGGMWKAL